MNTVYQVIQAAKKASEKSAFLTPWGVRECHEMEIGEIGAVFGYEAAIFWDFVRRGYICGKALS